MALSLPTPPFGCKFAGAPEGPVHRDLCGRYVRGRRAARLQNTPKPPQFSRTPFSQKVQRPEFGFDAAPETLINTNPKILSNSTNGTNACWLNTALYALASNPVVFKVFKTAVARSVDGSNTYYFDYDQERQNLQELCKPLMKRFNDMLLDCTEWDNPATYEIFEAILDEALQMFSEVRCESMVKKIRLMKVLSTARTLPEWDDRLYRYFHDNLHSRRKPRFGSYGSAQEAVEELVTAVSLNNPRMLLVEVRHVVKDLPSQIIYGLLNEEQEYALLSFINSTATLTEEDVRGDEHTREKIVQLAHWISYSNIDNARYMKFNAIETRTREVESPMLRAKTYYVGVYINNPLLDELTNGREEESHEDK